MGLGGSSIIVAVGSSTQGGTRTVVACADTASLGQVLLALCLADLDLLFLTAAADNFGRESALRLVVGTSVLGNVSLSHGCDASWTAGWVGAVAVVVADAIVVSDVIAAAAGNGVGSSAPLVE